MKSSAKLYELKIGSHKLKSMGYEILGHTADIRLKVWGLSREDLFRDALLGMMSIIKAKGEGRKAKNKRAIKIESADETERLVDFLNEALLQSNINKEVYMDVRFKSLSETKLEAELFG